MVPLIADQPLAGLADALRFRSSQNPTCFSSGGDFGDGQRRGRDGIVPSKCTWRHVSVHGLPARLLQEVTMLVVSLALRAKHCLTKLQGSDIHSAPANRRHARIQFVAVFYHYKALTSQSASAGRCSNPNPAILLQRTETSPGGPKNSVAVAA